MELDTYPIAPDIVTPLKKLPLKKLVLHYCLVDAAVLSAIVTTFPNLVHLGLKETGTKEDENNQSSISNKLIEEWREKMEYRSFTECLNTDYTQLLVTQETVEWKLHHVLPKVGYNL